MNHGMPPGTPGTAQPLRIGLALSGGGFRASIFHLGVIRRLEELGIMKEVSVISSVSGGSIIAAYYVIEMERRLRERRSEGKQKGVAIMRLEIFEEIIKDFFKALDHNLRTRALIFSPFYHPLKWIKSLFPSYSRSDLIQSEYDKWFYGANTLDQLPSVTRDDRGEGADDLIAGPKLILNTTSLMTGERIGFCREPVSGFKNTMSKVNKNVLKLSQIVGASSGVPGLFPPTPVAGNLLVDGGVSDNQGIEALMELEKASAIDIMLVSDAGGQMEQADKLSPKAASVLNRTISILQFQIRENLLARLRDWKEHGQSEVEQKAENINREFAFVHLYLNLKDRQGDPPRVPSEYIPGLARIRTDLDQFSFIEREALMYHGYTLIDSQIKTHCPDLKGLLENKDVIPPLKRPPLFFEEKVSDQGKKQEEMKESEFLKRRKRIQGELEAGRQGVFLLRAWKKYPWKAGAILLAWLILLVAIFGGLVRPNLDIFTEAVISPYLVPWLQRLIPSWLTFLFSKLNPYVVCWPITAKGLTLVIAFGLVIYLFAFSTYLIVRSLIWHWDLRVYKNLTGKEPSTKW